MWVLNVTINDFIKERQRKMRPTHKRRQCNNSGKDWKDVATSQAMPAATRTDEAKNGFSLRGSRGTEALLTA